MIDFLLELSGELLDFKTSYVLFVLGTQGRMDFFLYPHLILQVIILVSQKRYLREQSLLAGCWLLGDEGEAWSGWALLFYPELPVDFL